MTSTTLLIVVLIYFALLFAVAYYTGRGATEHSFFSGNRQSKWWLVAFGMIGTSLSGVTFVSVPGGVSSDGFKYLQVTLGYFVGYLVVAYVLLPLYYKMNLTSIYQYLQVRLGRTSSKTGSAIFLVSRSLGATARLYLVIKIMQDAILSNFGVPFEVTALIILLMILVYTYQGGVKTIVYTDTLQTTCMLGGLVICTVYILNHLPYTPMESWHQMSLTGLNSAFSFDVNSKQYFLKQILAGAFITITMTGLDQEMMQKNISINTVKGAQKNMLTMATILVAVITLFLLLGALLTLFAQVNSIEATGDKLFPTVALQHLPAYISVIFIVALISALFPSADGAITALTASVCVDMLDFNQRTDWDANRKKQIRQRVHLMVAGLFLLGILLFKHINNPSMIGLILRIAGYTYGPLLGLFAFGILTNRRVKDITVPIICIISPILCYFIDTHQQQLFGQFQIGLELLIINGLITFLGLWLFSSSTLKTTST